MCATQLVLRCSCSQLQGKSSCSIAHISFEPSRFAPCWVASAASAITARGISFGVSATMIDSGGTPAVVAGMDSNRFLRHPPPTPGPHKDSEIIIMCTISTVTPPRLPFWTFVCLSFWEGLDSYLCMPIPIQLIFATFARWYESWLKGQSWFSLSLAEMK